MVIHYIHTKNNPWSVEHSCTHLSLGSDAKATCLCTAHMAPFRSATHHCWVSGRDRHPMHMCHGHGLSDWNFGFTKQEFRFEELTSVWWDETVLPSNTPVPTGRCLEPQDTGRLALLSEQVLQAQLSWQQDQVLSAICTLPRPSGPTEHCGQEEMP